MAILDKRGQPLETDFRSLLGGGRNRRVPATETLGHAGTAIFGGYVVENEKENSLTGRERYTQYSQALANCSIVAAGVRYFLNLCARASWQFAPADHPRGVELAEMAEKILTDDPTTSWARIVRRAAMYRFYGFSIQEWTARRRADGVLTLADVAPRAQITIERWDVNTDGSVNGVVQRSPQDQRETYLPRGKLVYLVDDTLNDSPEGLGLFRHIMAPIRRLKRYEQLEGFGFETDLRGIPIGRAPYAELRQMVQNGTITQADAIAAVAPLEAFIKNHIKNPELGLLLDSQPYSTTDEATRPSTESKFDLSLMDGPEGSLPEIAQAIERVNREIARILGVESILLGEGDRGSFALARDKTNQFSLTVDSTLEELAQSFHDDLLRVVWRLNGWPEEAMPTLEPEAASYRDVEQIATALAELARSGAMLTPDDPAVNEVRALLGLSPTDDLTRDEDVSLIGDNGGPPLEDEDDVAVQVTVDD